MLSMQQSIVLILKKYWFLFGIPISILLAYLVPDIGKTGGVLRPEYSIKYGAISFIFFASGLAMKSSVLLDSIMNYRIHLFIQSFNFILFPSIVYATVHFVLLRFMQLEHTYGFLVVAAMPTPVGTSIILTKAAGANEAVAVFNSAFGSLLGVIVSPLILYLCLGQFANVSIGSVIAKLSVTVLLPTILGQITRRYLPRIDEYTTILSNSCKFTLLLIIFTTFCDTFSNKSIGIGLLTLSGIALLVLLFHLFFLSLAFEAAKRLSFAPADVVPISFASSQKSLTMGIPILKLLFASDPKISIYALPLLLYEPTQIIIGSIVAEYFRFWLNRFNERVTV